MADSMAGPIDWLKKGISANNSAINVYKDCIAMEDTENANTIMELRAIAMLEHENEQATKAIEILRNYDKTRM